MGAVAGGDADQVGAVRGRHPQHFQRFDRRRQMAVAFAVAAFALLVFAMGELGFFDGKLLAGLGRLAEMAAGRDPGTDPWRGRTGSECRPRFADL